jgi:uncharacterized membrane protein YhaH (DUF805 family)
MSPLKLLFSFEGRSCRRTYWLAGIFSFVVLLLAVYFLQTYGLGTKMGRLLFIVSFIIGFWSQLAVSVRRCHDLGFSGWLLLIWLVPYVGNLAWFVWGGFLRGNRGPNKYGDDPLHPGRQPDVSLPA